MNFSEDGDVGKVYLSTKSELDRFTNYGDLSLGRQKKTQQEAFGERRHLHVCDLWHVIVTF